MIEPLNSRGATQIGRAQRATVAFAVGSWGYIKPTARTLSSTNLKASLRAWPRSRTISFFRAWERLTLRGTSLTVPEVFQELTVRGPKAGRNGRCPCGSGKKYKKCCASS